MSRYDCSIRSVKSRVLVVLALVLACSLLRASTSTESVSAQSASVQITSTSTEAWPSIGATVTVIDASGQPITGLPPQAFAATLAGANLELTGLQTTSEPGIGVAVVLAFDVSGSMAGPPLENARAAGQALIAQLGPSDQAAIVTFANQPAVIQQFTADKGALSTGVNSLVAGGNTSLYAGVEESVRLAKTAPLPRRAVVLLSDGYNFGAVSDVDPASTITSVANSGGLFFTIGLGNEIDGQYLTQLAQAGHAQFLSAPTPDDLRMLYVTAGNILRQQYVLALDASHLTLPAGNASLQVDVDVGGAIGTGEIQIAIPAPVSAPSVTPVQTASPAVQRAPVDQESSGSGWIIAVGAVGLLAAGTTTGGILFIRRRGTGARGGEVSIERLMREPAPMAFPEIVRATGPDESPVWIEGPAGRRTPLGDVPITVGYSADCSLYLGNGNGGPLGRVRIWRRDGRYMLHNLSGGGHVTVGGKPVTWVILEDGDEIVVDGAALVFHDTQ